MRIHEPDKDGPGTEERSPQEGKGGGRRMVLAAIVVVLTLFGYLYLFTDLITSHKKPLPAVEAPVRKPLPRKGVVQRRITTAIRPAAGTPAAPSAGVPAVAPVRQGEQARATAPVRKITSPAAEAPVKKPAPVVQRPLPAKPLPVTAESRKSAPVTPSPQQKTPAPAAAGAPPSAPPVTPAASPPLSYRIQCGPFVSSREMGPAKAILRKAGLRMTTTPGPKRPTSMYRLFVATYPDAAAAAQEEKRLRESTPDTFVLPVNGAYELFGGSYHEEKRARMMQERLAARGVTTEFRQVTAPVPTRWLTASGVPSRDAAESVAERLKKNGIACRILKQDR